MGWRDDLDLEELERRYAAGETEGSILDVPLGSTSLHLPSGTSLDDPGWKPQEEEPAPWRYPRVYPPLGADISGFVDESRPWEEDPPEEEDPREGPLPPFDEWRGGDLDLLWSEEDEIDLQELLSTPMATPLGRPFDLAGETVTEPPFDPQEATIAIPGVRPPRPQPAFDLAGETATEPPLVPSTKTHGEVAWRPEDEQALRSLLVERPEPASGPGSPDTTEQEFQQWWRTLAPRLGLNPNPDDPQHYYDYRAAYRAGVSGPDESGHWPSKFKLGGHPNLVIGGIDTRTGQPRIVEPQRLRPVDEAIIRALAREGIDPETAIPATPPPRRRLARYHGDLPEPTVSDVVAAQDALREAGVPMPPRQMVPGPAFTAGPRAGPTGGGGGGGWGPSAPHEGGFVWSEGQFGVLPRPVLPPGQRDIVARTGQGIAAGALASTAGLLTGLDYLSRQAGVDIAALRTVADRTDALARAVAVKDPTYYDELTGAVGSVATFLVPGLGVMGVTGRLAILAPRLAQWAGVGAQTALEATAEAGAVYRDMVTKGRQERARAGEADNVRDSDEAIEARAIQAANHTLAGNVVLLGLTSKFDLLMVAGRRGWRALKAAVGEGTQELGQEAISTKTKGEAQDPGRLATAASIGSVVGGGFGSLLPPGAQVATPRPRRGEVEARALDGTEVQTTVVPPAAVPETPPVPAGPAATPAAGASPPAVGAPPPSRAPSAPQAPAAGVYAWVDDTGAILGETTYPTRDAAMAVTQSPDFNPDEHTLVQFPGAGETLAPEESAPPPDPEVPTQPLPPTTPARRPTLTPRSLLDRTLQAPPPAVQPTPDPRLQFRHWQDDGRGGSWPEYDVLETIPGTPFVEGTTLPGETFRAAGLEPPAPTSPPPPPRPAVLPPLVPPPAVLPAPESPGPAPQTRSLRDRRPILSGVPRATPPDLAPEEGAQGLGRDERYIPPATPEPAPTEAPPAGSTRWLARADLTLDPDRFQYKIESRTRQGGTGALAGVTTINPEFMREIDVWYDPADQRTYVVNGHNRIEAADRLRYTAPILVRYLPAQSAAEARFLGALENIVDDKGGPIDAAKFFRETGYSRETALASGLAVNRPVIGQGLSLARLAPPLWQRVLKGDLSVARGVIIGDRVADPDTQIKLIQLLEKKERGALTLSDRGVAELAEIMAGAPRVQRRQIDFFESPEAEQAAIETAHLLATLRTRLADDRRLFRMVGQTSRAARLAEEGAGEVDLARSQEVGQQASEVLAVFDVVKRQQGPIRDTINQAAAEIAAGGNRRAITDRAYAAIRAALPAVLRRGAAPSEPSGRRAPQGPADAGGGGAPDVKPRAPTGPAPAPVPPRSGPVVAPPPPAASQRSLRDRRPGEAPEDQRPAPTSLRGRDTRLDRETPGPEHTLQTPEGTPLARLRLLRGDSTGRGASTYEVLEWLDDAPMPPIERNSKGATYQGYFRGRTSDRLFWSKTGEVSREGAPLGYLPMVGGADNQYIRPEATPTREQFTYESTPEGPQALIPGAERRAVPTPGPIRRPMKKPPLESVQAEVNLFNQAAKADQVRLEESQGTLFQARPPEPGPIFYSGLRRAIEAKMPARASGPQVQALLTGLGVKADEVEWTGIREWLGTQPSGLLDKADVLAFLDTHAVRLEETQYGAPTTEARAEIGRLRQELHEIRTHPAKGGPVDQAASYSPEQQRRSTEITRRILDLDQWNVSAPRYSDFTAPGGTDHRELLMHLPARPAPPPELLKWKRVGEGRWEATGRAGDFSIVASDTGGFVVHAREFTDEPFATLEEAKANADEEELRFAPSDWVRAEIADNMWLDPRGNFRDIHWAGVPNIVVHARTTERETTDEKRVLYGEEVQSGWHQEGRKKGYRQPDHPQQENYAAWGARRGMTEEEVRATWQTNDPRTLEWEAEQRRAFAETNRPPPAPFATTWHELMLKRLLRVAVEEHYDGLAWTTGKQASVVMGLTGHIDTLEFSKERPGRNFGTLDLMATLDGDEVISRRNVTPAELTELVGAEIAERIAAWRGETHPEQETEGSLTGLDLQIGGRGMIGFYDKMLPDFMRKYVKKWGATVGTTEIVMARPGSIARRPSRTQASTLQAHFVEITPAMRESVLGGQPLFATSTGDVVVAEAEFRAGVEAGDAIEGTDLRLTDTSPSVPEHERERLRGAPQTRAVARLLESALAEMTEALGEPGVSFYGLSTDPRYYAANHQGTILLNPYALADAAVRRAGAEGVDPYRFAKAFSMEAYESLVHEVAHQGVRGHGVEFREEVKRIYEQLRPIEPRLLGTLEDALSADRALLARALFDDALRVGRHWGAYERSVGRQGQRRAPAAGQPAVGALALGGGGQGGGGPPPALRVRPPGEAPGDGPDAELRGGGADARLSPASPDATPPGLSAGGVAQTRNILSDQSGAFLLPDLRALAKDIGRTLGTRQERYRALRGRGPGTSLYWAEKLYIIRQQAGDTDLSVLVDQQLTRPEIWRRLRATWYVTPPGAARISRGLQHLGGWAGVAQQEQGRLFQASEAIRSLDPQTGQPIFGTRKFFRHPDGTARIDPQTGQPMWAWRYTAADGQALWNNLSPQAKQAAKWWVSHREAVKVQYGIVATIEGYMHHFFEDGVLDGFRKIQLARRKAAPRRLRLERPGFVEDFRKSVLKGLLDLEHERQFNAFITTFVRLATKPVDPAVGVEPGWKVIERTQATKRAVFVGKLAGGRQIPKELYDDFVRYVEPLAGVKVSREVVRATIWFLKANLLTRPATASTNLISGGLQYAGHVYENLVKAVMTGDPMPFLENIMAIAAAFGPNAIEQIPSEVWGGSRSNTLSEFASRPFQVTGRPSLWSARYVRGLERADRLMLWHYGAIENYCKRVIAISDLKARGRPIDRAAILASDAALIDLNTVVDRYGLDYWNVPEGIRKMRESATGAGITLYPTYLYKLSRLYTYYFNGFGTMVAGVREGDRAQFTDGFARVATLGTIAALMWLDSRDDDDRKDAKGTGERWPGIPTSVDRAGRLFVWTTEEGKALWAGVSKYPFFNLVQAIHAGGDVVEKVGSGASLGESATWDEASRFLGQTIQPGPLLEAWAILSGHRDDYDQGKAPGTRWAEFWTNFIPFSPMLRDTRNLRNRVRTQAWTPGQAVARSLGVNPEAWGLDPEKWAKDELTGQAIVLNPTLEQLKFWLGVNFMEIDPAIHRKARRREHILAIEALEAAFGAANLGAFDRNVQRLRTIAPERYAKMADRLTRARVRITRQQSQRLAEWQAAPSPPAEAPEELEEVVGQ